ncbi:ABC transporter permease [Kribbella turkmenica]|uniref:ABC transporter permease n=1 Tax=Kribbella turkmenica TaxID=2530375 RepID=A0A4R4XBH3_9ACTN|nr:ABC transporter permease [Kribbella turkmenica]TDD27904.1 ABC transporter permease [Kribbella turkmenica]
MSAIARTAGAKGSAGFQYGLKLWALRALLVAIIAGAWSYAAGPGGVADILLPSIPQVAAELGSLVKDPVIWRAAGLTLGEMAIAFVLGASLGIVVGLWAGRRNLRARVTDPLLAWGYIVPSVVFYPLFLLWFGLGSSSKVLYAAVGAFFPIAFNTIRGLKSVDPKFVRLGKAFGASKRQLDVSIKLGAAMPMVLSGVRIGVALTTIAVILGEMLAASAGLGFELAKSFNVLQTARGFAVMVILMVLVGLVQLVANRALSHFRH